MPGNTTPIFPGAPDIAWCTLTSANTAYDGTGTVGTAFTAGSLGSLPAKIQAKPLGTNVATVASIFINNGSTNTVAANNSFYDEIALPATTASNTAALPTYTFPLAFPINNGYKINIALRTAVASGWQFTVVGGDY